MEYIPRKHQQLAYDFALKHPRCGLFLDMGLGKTVITLSLIKTYLTLGTVTKVLIIAPLNTARYVWKQEAQIWDHTQDLRISLVIGTEKQRVKALNECADIYVINVENIPWLCSRPGWDFDGIVIDELSTFKKYNTRRFKSLKAYTSKAKIVIGLTGTPASNGYENLFSEIYLLDGGERLGKYITEYRMTYFRPGAHNGNVVYNWVLKPHAKELIDRKLREICVSMSKDDWLNMPERIETNVYVDLDPSERKLYDRLKNDQVLPLLKGAVQNHVTDDFDDVIMAEDPAHLASVLLQCSSGNIYAKSGAVIPIHAKKIEMMQELIESLDGDPVLVFYQFLHEKDLILKTFPQAKLLTPETKELWDQAKVPILLCHPASAGHGINLQRGGNRILWYSLPWSLEQYQQANARLYRQGQTKPVIQQHLMVRGTYEDRVLRVLHQKDATQASLLESLTHYLKGD